MTSVDKPALPENTVQCPVCLKEVPRSAAIVPENRDYVHYFCGRGCHDEWMRCNPRNRPGDGA